MLEHIPHARGDANICGDVGSPKVVRFGEKGLMWVEVEATGSPAHGAHVHRGTNAIDRLRVALDRLKELETIPFQAPPVVTAGDRQRQGDLGAAVGRRRVRDAAARDGQHRHDRRRHLAQPGADARHRPRRHPAAGRHHHRRAGGEARRMAGAAGGRELARDPPLRALLHPTRPTRSSVRTAKVAAEVLGSAPAVNMRVGGSDSRWYRPARRADRRARPDALQHGRRRTSMSWSTSCWPSPRSTRWRPSISSQRS